MIPCTRARFVVVAVVAVMLLGLVEIVEARDWAAFPASVEIHRAPRLVAVGDIHGGFAEMAATLEATGMAKRTDPEGFALTWTGGRDLLVFCGDFTDRGEYSKEVYDAVMSLEQQAPKAGGTVIPLFGNHEALLLNGTVEYWAKTLKPPKKQHYQNTIDSFTRGGLDFHEAISPKGKYGTWIRNRPLFAVINGFLFVHGGLPHPAASLRQLVQRFKTDLEAGDFNKGIFMDHDGPLWNRKWIDLPDTIEQNMQMMGIRGVVFGHTIGAFGNNGVIEVRNPALISIDVGMCPAYGNSKGGALEMLVAKDGTLTVKAMYPDRPTVELLSLPGINRPRPAANEELPATGTK